MWDLIANHYSGRMGLSSENITKRALLQRPDAGPFSGAHASLYDLCGFTTLMFYGDDDTGAQMPDGNIQDGVYLIKNLNSSLYLDEGDVVIQNYKTDENNQNWIVTHLGGGQYSIINAESKLALTVENGSQDDGDNVVEREFVGSENQRFAFLPEGEGYKITASQSGKPIGVTTRSLEAGKIVHQWKDEYSNHQVWILEMIKPAASINSVKYDGEVFEYGGKTYLKKGEKYTVSFDSDYDLSDNDIETVADGDFKISVSAYDDDTIRTYEFEYSVYENTSDIIKELLTSYDENAYYTKESSEEFLSLLKTAESYSVSDNRFEEALEKLLQLEKGLEETDGADIKTSKSSAEIYSSRPTEVSVIEAVRENGTVTNVKKYSVSIDSGETKIISPSENGTVYLWDSLMRPITEKLVAK
jgi:hypothetical protein